MRSMIQTKRTNRHNMIAQRMVRWKWTSWSMNSRLNCKFVMGTWWLMASSFWCVCWCNCWCFRLISQRYRFSSIQNRSFLMKISPRNSLFDWSGTKFVLYESYDGYLNHFFCCTQPYIAMLRMLKRWSSTVVACQIWRYKVQTTHHATQEGHVCFDIPTRLGGNVCTAG